MERRNDVREQSADLTRRAAIGRVAAVGAGALAALTGGPGIAPVASQAGGVAPLPVPPDPRFPNPPTWERELRELAPNVYAYVQAGGPGRDNVSVSDAGLIVGDEGVMVIDTLGAPMHAKAFIAEIRKVTEKPFRHVIITHHHGDHINGNQYFEGAEFVSHPYCRDEVLKVVNAGGPANWAKREGWADGSEPRKIIAPTTTFDGRMTYHYGRNVVEVFPMVPAHTYGDLVVHLPQHRIMFVGDIGFFYVVPFCQNAHPSNWIEVCHRIERMDVQTIVPGHGPLGGKAELAEMRDYLALLKREAKARYDAKMSAGAAAADIRMGKYDNWVGPERIIMDTARFYDEFDGTLRPEVNTAAIRRATEEYNAARKPAAR
jgi:glyoxylase-like metal-dependent hydrolase (beta-lactamase superfamily II)